MSGVGPISQIEEIPARLVDREPKAFQDFARAFGTAFRSHFLDKGLEPYEADDLAISLLTDIPLKVIKGHFHHREDGSFKAWVFALMRNAGNDWWRKRRGVDVVPIRDDVPEPVERPLDERADLVLAVRDALAVLPESARQIIELRDLEGSRDYADIAAQLGISSGAARVRHLRALAQLAGVLIHDPRLKRALPRAQLTIS
jgi:RNA polymerase sigma factor (sigma-70 family)